LLPPASTEITIEESVIGGYPRATPKCGSKSPISWRLEKLPAAASLVLAISYMGGASLLAN